MNEYSNIRSTGSDYQLWPSSVERLPEMGGESRIKSRAGEFDLTESIFCSLCIIHKDRRCFVPLIDSGAKQVLCVWWPFV